MRLEPASEESPENVPGQDPVPDFAALVRDHHRELLVYARALSGDSATARDIVQDAFIVAYEKFAIFDVTRDFATWMRGIVRNKWREWLRRNRRYDLGDHELARMDADIADWQSSRLRHETPLFEALEECLSRLPETLRKTVDAYYYEGRSGDEAALRLGVEPAAVRKRLQRARILLKQCLELKQAKTSPQNES